MGSWFMSGSDTFWLNFTNLALGLATLEAWLWVTWGLLQEAAFRRRLRKAAVIASHGLALLFAVALVPHPAEATVEMQNQAKKLGFAIKNCLDCHASPHAVDVMHKKAKDLKMADGNCLACHGANIPVKLNQQGEWLVAEKARRGAKACDMAWLKGYQQPSIPVTSTGKAGAKGETGQIVPRP
ncbi:MAG TPA: hypothetical protein VMT70_10100 [Vicinamibacteria bacterium]|nr:hypothetical protein [Vicinamibacteria bacterium]